MSFLVKANTWKVFNLSKKQNILQYFSVKKSTN